MMAAEITLCLAGEFRALRDGREIPVGELGSRKARLLLKLLAVERGQRVSADRIVAVLWPDEPPRQPVDNVATLVSRLRGVLGPDAIRGDRTGWRLADPPAVEIDLARAAADLAEAQRCATDGAHPLALAAARATIDRLAPGTALADEPYADWAQPARDELDRLLAGARLTGAAAALALSDPATARDLAAAAAGADRYDEEAARLLMRAEAGSGRLGRALAAYEALRDRLATEFGADPAPATRDLHLAILREETPAIALRVAAPGTRSKVAALAGRTQEMARLTAAWTAAAGGTPTMVLITGEAGIGKTSLASTVVALATGTGGTVLEARCYETERSLFLQPLVEAIGRHAATASPGTVRGLVGDGGAELGPLVPELGALVGDVPSPDHISAEIQLTRTYRAITRYLCRLATAPLLLLLDDLHQAGLATVELLHYLARHAGAARLPVLATVRTEEGAAVRSALGDIAESLELGPLDPDPGGGRIARCRAGRRPLPGTPGPDRRSACGSCASRQPARRVRTRWSAGHHPRRSTRPLRRRGRRSPRYPVPVHA
jgi:DNA-binding SARP family transcriptional activator